MAIVISDSSLRDILGKLTYKAEIHDTAGNILGYYTPRDVEVELLYQYAAEHFDPEEIRRELERKPEGLPLDQVLKTLTEREKA